MQPILQIENDLFSRRKFCGAMAAGLLLSSESSSAPKTPEPGPGAQPRYLTPQADFGTVERGTPLPYKLPADRLRAAGLTRESWSLEVISDPAAPAQIERPLSRASGTSFNWAQLMRLAEKYAVRFLKVLTCNNGGTPLGMGLWEGVPLRTVLWLARPKSDLRRVFYYGYHNDDPKQRFLSSLSIGRVFEDPPGEYPVILCYKLNGEFLTGKRGGPVRIIVPEAYGFKSVKWLTHVVLTNAPAANDTYAAGNNDLESPMKTFARFVAPPETEVARHAFQISGLAQVGQSGLTQVQYWVRAADKPLPGDDPHFEKGAWKDARILPRPSIDAADRNDRRSILGVDSSNRPTTWPMRYTIARWEATVPGLPAGHYELRCRTIDANGIAQPMPRPFPKSGRNSIEKVDLRVVDR